MESRNTHSIAAAVSGAELRRRRQTRLWAAPGQGQLEVYRRASWDTTPRDCAISLPPNREGPCRGARTLFGMEDVGS